MQNRTAFLRVGVLFVVAGILVVPLLYGIGLILLVIGGVSWAPED